MARPLNYSTKIPAKETAIECVHLLAEAGADAVAVQYADKQPVGVSFGLGTPYGPREFALPVNVDGVHAMLRKMIATNPPRVSAAERNRLASRAHAADVGWRVIRDWLEAQLAIIEAGMVTLDEVMIPYVMVEPGQTIRDRWVGGRMAIAAP